MKILVDELPMLPEDCPLFSSGDCRLDGKTCGARNGEGCNCLKEFKPFVFEPQFKATFSTLDLPDTNSQCLRRRLNVLADLLDIERSTDPRQILDITIEKLTEKLIEKLSKGE